MPPKLYRVEGLEAEPTHVEEGTSQMYKAFQAMMEEKQWSIIDAFMIAHSFHKMVVLSVMVRWRLDGFDAEKTLHLADMTWRNAIKQITKSLKPQSPSSLDQNASPLAPLRNQYQMSPRSKPSSGP